MNKKLFIILFFAFCMGCHAKELRGDGNPRIGKIIAISSCNILSEYSDDEVFPKYELTVALRKKCRVTRLELVSNYLFGQNLNIVSSRLIVLEQGCEELEELNASGVCRLTVELPPLKKETETQEYAEGLLNEERVSNAFTFLRYD